MTDKTFLTEENPDKSISDMPSISDMMDPNWCEECGKVCECEPGECGCNKKED
tara:strand:+ start:1991 stop:2149 length:159 start_codon:yes stop_codon:yes gene_type:complete